MKNQQQPFPPNENQVIRLDAFRERLKKREIWINGNIDESLVEKLYINLIDLEAQSNVLPLTVVINSIGGNYWESIVATDIMGTLNCPVKTVALANAVSGGFILFMGGQERIMHDYSCLMMHSVSTGAMDKIQDIKERLEYIESSQDKMAKFFALQTGGKTTPEYWTNLFKSGKDKWFSVEEALKLGIAHRVVRRTDMVDPDFSIRKPYTWDIWDIAKSQLQA
jgi:ATP-dependent protease ClpP protease subunit